MVLAAVASVLLSIPAAASDWVKIRKIGATPLPDIQVYTEEWKPVSPREPEQSLIILHFWATWCPPCVEELPKLDAFAGRNPSGLRLLAVSLDGKSRIGKAKDFFVRHRIQNAALMFDARNALFHAVEGSGLPITLFVRGGHIIARAEGPVDWEAQETEDFILEEKGTSPHAANTPPYNATVSALRR